MRAFAQEVAATCARAKAAGVNAAWVKAVEEAIALVASLTMELAQRGLSGDVDGMMLHASDYLALFSTVVIAWQWLDRAAAAREGLARDTPAKDAFYRGKLAAAQYWIMTDLPRIQHLAHLCRSSEDSYETLEDGWL